MNTVQDAQQQQGKARYMPGLDGLRALSVLAVIAYHINVSWAPGGLLGVGIFFTLSGYLITDQLIAQWQRTKRLDLKDFWIRRFRRLMPAMFFMLAVVAIWLLLIDHSRLASLQGDFLSSILYVNNWWLIFHEVSYFESFGPPSPIGHLWSLAIEEQFYLLWPLVLVLALHILKRRGKLIVFIMLGALVSALVMAIIYEPGTDPSRVYYGTDTRAFALLVGAALAVVWPSRGMTEQVSARSRRLLDSVGGIGLVLMLVTIFVTTGYSDLLYHGGLALFAVLSAIVTAALAHPASTIGKLLGSKLLRWIGMRSYSLYLWHFPVIILTTPLVNTNGFSVGRAIFQMMLTVLLATISWKYVEEPIRNGSWRNAWHNLTRWYANFPMKYRLGAGVAMFFVLIIFCYGMTNMMKPTVTVSSNIVKAPEDSSLEPSITALPSITPTVIPTVAPEQQGTVKEPAGPKETKPNSTIDPEVQKPVIPTPQPEGSVPPDKEPTSTEVDNGTDEPNEPNTDTENTEAEIDQGAEAEHPDTSKEGIHSELGKEITAIGDSVLLDVAPHLQTMLPGIVIDGKVGRQMSQAKEVLNQLKMEGKLRDRIIIELGTNGAFSKKQLRQLLSSLEDSEQVLLINTRVPREWQDAVNTTLATVANEFDNVSLIDWYSASKDMNEIFANDGVHLNQEGSKLYASLVSDAVQ